MNQQDKIRISGKVVLREMNKVIGVKIKDKNGQDVIVVDTNMNAYKNETLRIRIVDEIRMQFSLAENTFSDFDIDKLKKYFKAHLTAIISVDHMNKNYNDNSDLQEGALQKLITNLTTLKNKNHNVNVDSIIGLIEQQNVIEGEDNKYMAKLWLVMSEFDFFCESDLEQMQKEYTAEDLAYIIARALSKDSFMAICNFIDNYAVTNNGGRNKSKYVKKTKKNVKKTNKNKSSKKLKINKKNMKK